MIRPKRVRRGTPIAATYAPAGIRCMHCGMKIRQVGTQWVGDYTAPEDQPRSRYARIEADQDMQVCPVSGGWHEPAGGTR